MNQTAQEEWHLVIQACPPDSVPGPVISHEGVELPTLDLGGRPVAEPLAVKFDDVLTAFDQLGMFVEGDGSFCWTAPQAVWRIFGEIYDGAETVQYVELKGQCPTDQLRRVFDVLGAERHSIMVQLVRMGVHCTPGNYLTWVDSGRSHS